MEIVRVQDVKYSIGDMMYELLPRAWRQLDQAQGQREIVVQNDFGTQVTISGAPLQRFLLMLGFEADVWLVTIQDALKKMIDPETCLPEQLPALAFLLRAHLSPFATEQAQRQLLKVQLEILKRKGSPECIEMLTKFLVGWKSSVSLFTSEGYGLQAYGISSYGGAAPADKSFELVIAAAHADDPSKTEKSAYLLEVLPVYLPPGVTFDIVFAA